MDQTKSYERYLDQQVPSILPQGRSAPLRFPGVNAAAMRGLSGWADPLGYGSRYMQGMGAALTLSYTDPGLGDIYTDGTNAYVAQAGGVYSNTVTGALVDINGNPVAAPAGSENIFTGASNAISAVESAAAGVATASKYVAWGLGALVLYMVWKEAQTPEGRGRFATQAKNTATGAAGAIGGAAKAAIL